MHVNRFPTTCLDGSLWPPQDPSARFNEEDDPKHVLKLPSTPWTYNNGSLNPGLRSNSLRKRRSARGPISSLPPYHSDYKPPGEEDTYPVSSSEDEYEQLPGRGGKLVRQDSEGYLVQSIDREEMLRRFVEERVEEPGRYQRYIPESTTDSEDDDDTPLSAAGF